MTTMRNNKANNEIEQVNNNKGTMIMVSASTTDASTWIENRHRFFDKEDQHSIYLQNSEDIFAKLTSAIQRMIGCEAYWSIVDKTAE